MGGIPTVNIVAVVHLFFIAMLFGCLFAEGAMEMPAIFFQKKLRRSAIRHHVWMDIFVEIPVFLGVIISGITMAVHVEELTTLHFIKIGVVSCVLFVWSL